MRILHIVTDIRIANGIMRVIFNYMSAMPADVFFDVAYFRQFPQNHEKEITARGGHVFHLSQPTAKFFRNNDWDVFLKKYASEYDAVHIHAPHLASLVVPKLHKYGLNRIAVHCHSTWYSLFPKNRFRNHLLSIPVRFLPVKRFACGKDAGMFWYKNPKRFTVLPNALFLDDFCFRQVSRCEKRKELGIHNAFVVGHIGRVAPPQKNHPFLFRIFAEIKKQRPEAILLLVGAEKNDELSSLAETLGISSSVSFLGSRRDVPALLSAMDVFVFPSLYEGLPVSVVEAQAAGLPVVMSDRITDEVVATKSVSILSLDGSPQRWAETAIRLFESHQREEKNILENTPWNIQNSVKTLLNFYQTGQ